MKEDEKQYLTNLVEYSKVVYIHTYNTAVSNDFSDKKKLDKLDSKVFGIYSKYYRKPKKIVKFMAYICGIIYNNEIMVDSNLYSDIILLSNIATHRLFSLKKFNNFIVMGRIEFIKMGVRNNRVSFMIDNLLRGVKCC